MMRNGGKETHPGRPADAETIRLQNFLNGVAGKWIHLPILWAAFSIFVVLAAAMWWYPPLWQPHYAPVHPAPYFQPGPDAVPLNSASAAELMLLPGIGEKRAEAIVEYRRQNGLFTDVEQLLEVPGIGPKILEQIREHIVL